eukprot:TRINITY_DN7562_c0_g2_i2.p1 TRINITY_DN7562_c0_g2~~TRINITY_DN7562_c0_g2_i2.p1  ORF type:complete len:432 (-),score=79.33 TRINITY_DN7562_c0_g2_i2:546-1841(-)
MAEGEGRRVRLEWSDWFHVADPLRRCWFAVPATTITIAQLCAQLAVEFALPVHQHSLTLVLEGFVLPPTQRVTLLRDNDHIQVIPNSSSSSTNACEKRKAPRPLKPIQASKKRKAQASSSSSSAPASPSSSSSSSPSSSSSSEEEESSSSSSSSDEETESPTAASASTPAPALPASVPTSAPVPPAAGLKATHNGRRTVFTEEGTVIPSSTATTTTTTTTTTNDRDGLLPTPPSAPPTINTEQGAGRGRGRGAGAVGYSPRRGPPTRNFSNQVWQRPQADTASDSNKQPSRARPPPGVTTTDTSASPSPSASPAPANSVHTPSTSGHVATDYTSWPVLPTNVLPAVGNRLAYRILQLHGRAPPTLSAYKEVVVDSYDGATGCVTVRPANTGSVPVDGMYLEASSEADLQQLLAMPVSLAMSSMSDLRRLPS